MSELLLPTRLTIAEVGALRELLIAHLAGSAGEVQLDGSAVEECDTAGLQLLLSAARTVSASHRELRLLRCSAALRRTIELASVTTRLGVTDPADPEAAP